MIIKSPDGIAASVNGDNQLLTFSTVRDIGQALNISGKVFTGYFTVTPAGANDYFLYIKNTGTADIALGFVSVKSSVVTEINYEAVTGTPVYVTGTDVPLVNNNLGSTSPLNATVKYDTDITGLTSGGVVGFEQCSVADTKFVTSFSTGIIIPQGKAVAFKRVAATGVITCNIAIVEIG